MTATIFAERVASSGYRWRATSRGTGADAEAIGLLEVATKVEGGVEDDAMLSLKASRPLIRVLVINDNHYGLTILFEL
jgi:hypothetical protein